MLRRKPIILIWVGLLFMLTSYSQTKAPPQFWERIEVGTNLIPIVDSLTLKFDNLQVKYFYDKDQNRAVRLNIFKNGGYLDPTNWNHTWHNSANYKIEVGHMWYYSLKENVKLYQAADLCYYNMTDSWYLNLEGFEDDIRNSNTCYANYSLGLKLKIYKALSLEFDTRFQVGVWIYYQNYYYQGTQSIHKPQTHETFYFNYFPLHCLTLNYKL